MIEKTNMFVLAASVFIIVAYIDLGNIISALTLFCLLNFYIHGYDKIIEKISILCKKIKSMKE